MRRSLCLFAVYMSLNDWQDENLMQTTEDVINVSIEHQSARFPQIAENSPLVHDGYMRTLDKNCMDPDLDPSGSEYEFKEPSMK